MQEAARQARGWQQLCARLCVSVCVFIRGSCVLACKVAGEFSLLMYRTRPHRRGTYTQKVTYYTKGTRQERLEEHYVLRVCLLADAYMVGIWWDCRVDQQKRAQG